MKELYFNKDGKFKIVQFTDCHFSVGSANAEDTKTLAMMRSVIQEEKPDLVAVTGDFVCGEQGRDLLKEVVQPMEETGTPWAYVFGNHDTEEGPGKKVTMEFAQTFPNCLMRNMDDSVAGLGNYYVGVKARNGETKWTLFFLDSLDYNPIEKVGGYGFFHRSQINWYVDTEMELDKAIGKHSSLSFFHMALPEYYEVWYTKTCRGRKLEEVCSPRQNSGMFSAMLEAGNMRGVFVGHDHINDFIGELHGIQLCYGRGSGFNTYSDKGYIQGARVIELDENNLDGFQTWIRLHTGEVITWDQQEVHKPDYIITDLEY